MQARGALRPEGTDVLVEPVRELLRCQVVGGRPARDFLPEPQILGLRFNVRGMLLRVLFWSRAPGAERVHVPQARQQRGARYAQTSDKLWKRECLAVSGVQRTRRGPAEREAGEQPADMSGVVDSFREETVEKTVADEYGRAHPVCTDDAAWDERVGFRKECEERTEQAEDCTRGADARHGWIPDDTGQARQRTAGAVDKEQQPATEQSLRQPADVPERPHVEDHVREVQVDENRREQTPPLAAKGHRPDVRAPIGVLLRIEATQLAGGEGHDEIHEDVCRHERGRDPGPLADFIEAAVEFAQLDPLLRKSLGLRGG